MSLRLMYITNDPKIALTAQKYGVDRIWIDLEVQGKEERQKGRNSVKSQHKVKDISLIKPLLNFSEMLVRINPWNEQSKDEIDAVIEAGADIIMLPMWKTAKEVNGFIKAVNGRCRTMLLLETIEAEKCLDEVLKLSGIHEIHIGMNDLHIAYGLTFMFELLSNGKIAEICDRIRPSGIPFGFGGIGMPGAGLLLTPEKIILEHYRLGSTAAILSRTFYNSSQRKNSDEIDGIFKKGIKAIRDYEKMAEMADSRIYKDNTKMVVQNVNTIVENMHRK